MRERPEIVSSARRNDAIRGGPPWSKAAVVAIVAGAAALALFRSADPDFWFHLAAGRSIVTHGLPSRETWCLAALGDGPWTAEWLFQAALYLAQAWGGDAAIAAWRAAFASAAVWLALGLARTVEGRWWSALLVAPLALAVQHPRLVARGEQWLVVLALIALVALERARRGGRDRTGWLVPLQVLWANAHPSWILGPALVALYAASAALGLGRARDLARARRWAVLALGLLAASALTPHPLATFGEPARLFSDVRRDVMTQSIDELQPWSWAADAREPFTAFLGLCGLAALIGGARAYRVSPPLALVALGATAMGLGANRFQPLATLVAWPALAAALPSFSGRAPGGGSDDRRARRGQGAAASAPRIAPTRAILGLAAGCAAALAGFFFLVRDRSRMEPGIAPQWRAFPVRAVRLADSLGIEGPVLNTFEYGGHILWVRGESRPPLIDGRARGSALFRSRFARAMTDPAAHDSLLSMWPFTHAIVRPPRAIEDYLAVGLSRRPDWSLIFVDDAAYLFVHRARWRTASVRPAYALLTPDYPRMSRLCDAAREDPALAAALEGELQRARSDSPWHARASYWLAMLRLGLGRPRETLALLDEAERIRPTLPGLAIPRGIAWGMLGDRTASRKWLERALRNPESAAAARRILSEMR